MVVAALGDSLCGGYLIDGRYVDDANGSYPALVAQALGATQLGVVAIASAIIDTVADGIALLPPEADLLMMNAGTNDMVVVASEVRTLEAVVASFEGMLRRCRSWMPKARVVVVGLRNVAAMDPNHIAGPHSIRRLREPAKVGAAARAFNEHILTLPNITPVDLARRPGTDSVELFPDAIHPSPLGARWIADAVLEALR